MTCECGCGQPTRISFQTARKRGLEKGKPVRFVKGHYRKHPAETLARMRKDNPGYSAIHLWVRRNYPPTGVCTWCGKEGRTEYANISGEYLRTIDDYLELCHSCHVKFDKGG